MKRSFHFVASLLGIVASAAVGHGLGNLERQTVEMTGHSATRIAAQSNGSQASPASDKARLEALRKRLSKLAETLEGGYDVESTCEVFQLLKNLDADELEDLARGFSREPGHGGIGILQDMILAALIRKDPGIAARFLTEASRTQSKMETEAQLYTFSKLNPAATLEWLESGIPLDEEIRRRFRADTIAALAKEDMEVFRQHYAAAEPELQCAILCHLSTPNSEPGLLQEVARLSEALSTEEMQKIRAQLVEAICVQTPEKALTLALEWDFPKDKRDTLDHIATTTLIERGTDEVCRAALDGYCKRHPNDDCLGQPMDRAAGSWCERSPTAYVAWLDSLPDGPLRDDCAEAAARSKVNIPQAEALCAVVGDGKRRQQLERDLKYRRQLESPEE